MDQSTLGEGEPTGHCPSKRPLKGSVSPEGQHDTDTTDIDEMISKNNKMLSTLKESNLLLQQQLQMMERLAEMRIAKMKQESRRPSDGDERQVKLAEIRSTQAKLVERNAVAKRLISQQQELLRKQLDARREVLQQSASRVANLRAELVAAEAQEAELAAQLAAEQCEMQGHTEPSRPSGSEELSVGWNEEWFAEDERSFSADGADYARPLQCKPRFVTKWSSDVLIFQRGRNLSAV